MTEKFKFVLGKIEKLGNVRKCWLAALSPFPTTFSKGFFFKEVKGLNAKY